MTYILPLDLVTGHSLIDQQHTNILIFVSKLKGDELDMRTAFNLLLEHFTSHFGEEEKLMAEVQYPDTWMHKLAHMGFFDTFVNLRAIFDMEPSDKNRQVFVDGMVRWVETHVLGEDKKMIEFLRSNNPKAV